MKSVAIVAPDTDAGKTIITAALWKCVKKIVGKSIVMKPVQTGAELVEGRRVSSDIATIERLTGMSVPRDIYHHVVPYNFLAPCSPHLAAKKEIQEISLANIKQNLITLHMRFRMTLVETAGGILSPLTEDATNLDLVKELETPAIMVAQNRLGAISATLAAFDSLKNANIPVLGLIMVDTEKVIGDLEEEIHEDNLRIIAKMTGIENCVRVPFLENVEEEFEVLPALLEDFSEKVFESA